MNLIESVSLTEPTGTGSGYFYVRVHLGCDVDYANVAMPRLMKWQQTTCVADPFLYEKEISESKLEFVPLSNSNNFKVKVTGPETQKPNLAWIPGLNALHTDDRGKHLVFSEYVKDTPVTRAIVEELYNISKKPQPESELDSMSSYIEPLLVCLYMHWH